MRKLILPIVLASASFALAAEIELHGAVNADYGSYFDSDFSPINAANQDIDLAATARMDENVSVTVMANTHSTYVDSNGTHASETHRHYYAHSTAMGDEGGRYTEFNFDGDPSRYAVIVRDENLRGVGAEVGTRNYGSGKFYMGASDDNEHSMAMFATYSLPMLNHVDEHLVLTPSIDWMFGDDIGRSYTYSLGTEVDYSKSFERFNWGIYAVWGLHPYKGKGIHSFLLEPSMSYAFFNLGFTYFYALTDEDYAAEEQIFTEDQLLFAVEPLHKKLTMGFTYEYHDPDTEIHGNDYHFGGLNFYLYPTMKTEVVFWFGYNFSDNIDTDFAMGISAQAEF